MNFDDIYKMYINDVYRYLLSLSHNKEIAEDLLQDTFLKAYSSFENCHEGKVKSWLMTIARNTFIDYVRKNKRIVQKENSFFANYESDTNIEADEVEAEMKEEVQKNLSKLKEKYRKALTYFYLDELSVNEGADKMNITPNNFKVLIFRGRKKLKKYYGRNSDE